MPPRDGVGEVRTGKISIDQWRGGNRTPTPKVHLDDTTLDLVRKLHDQYPMMRRGALQDAVSAVIECGLDADHLRVALEHLPSWLKSGDWTEQGGKYVCNLSNWLRNGQWRCKPNVPGEREITNDEICAIYRSLTESD